MISRREALSAVALFSVLPAHSGLFGQETAAKTLEPSVQEQLTKHKDCAFEGETMSLDNSSFEGCTFRGCTLTYAGGPSNSRSREHSPLWQCSGLRLSPPKNMGASFIALSELRPRDSIAITPT